VSLPYALLQLFGSQLSSFTALGSDLDVSLETEPSSPFHCAVRPPPHGRSLPA